MTEALYYQYWGKAGSDDGQDNSYHLLPYHCLDVAAVGCVLLEQHPFLMSRFEQLFDLPKTIFVPWIKTLLALHDCGKFAESFQQLKPELRQTWWGEITKTNYDIRHDSLGFLLWHDQTAIRQLLPSEIIDSCLYRNVLKIWLQAVTGHHGLPPKISSVSAKTYFKPCDLANAAEFFNAINGLFTPDIPALVERVADEDWLDKQCSASWLLAGFTILCDWLGSDSANFKFCTDESLSLDDYWQQYALPSANRAVQNAGILPAQSVSKQSLQHLFSYLKKLTPLQAQSESLSLPQKPQLLILEDVTGAGKTEAAMMFAHRLISQELAQGVFIGLPTMATANAMYERVADCYLKIYADKEKPSLILAHGARHLSEKFQQSIMEYTAKDKAYGQKETTASVQCSRWLSDHRKKALLADVGIGTIDQALLSILPAKHQSLRLLGLANKVLESIAAIEIIKNAVANNQCVCWIRNTVFDARTAYSELQKVDWLESEQLMLFHSRYTLHDRKAVEDSILNLFGKKSSANSRQGKVLIATQVVEQSLDLDFDVMISDLAPIDLLIQRAGRLHRHVRDSVGNFIEESGQKDQRPSPTLFIYSPPLEQAPAQDWYKAVFPKANGVYPHTGQLWRTAMLLANKKQWRMPEDARELIETVYSEDDTIYPKRLKKPVMKLKVSKRQKWVWLR